MPRAASDLRFDSLQADDRVAQDRQHRIEHQRNEGRQKADPSAQQRYHQRQQRQTGNRLDDARHIQRHGRQPRTPDGLDTQRNAQHNPRQQGTHRKHNVGRQVLRQFGEALGEIGVHAPSSRIARIWRRGVSSRPET